MTQLLFFADPDELSMMDPEASPSEAFICMLGQGIHADARAQLYSLVAGEFLYDALNMEEPVDDLSTPASWINKLSDSLVEQISALDEETIIDTLEYWQQSEEVEGLNLDKDELLEYLFALVSLCQQAKQENASVYTYTTY
jgi:hypothetical protein